MTYDSRNYAKNWKEIALEVKKKSKWCCDYCGMHCYEPGERPRGLTRSEWMAHTLQVHHVDHDPTNNDRENLRSVCPKCHLALHRDKFSPVSKGQLSLF